MYRISTNGILWLSKDGFLIKRILDAKRFLTEMISTEKAIIQIREPNVIYQLRKEDGLWKRICMIEINDSGLYVEIIYKLQCLDELEHVPFDKNSPFKKCIVETIDVIKQLLKKFEENYGKDNHN